MKKLLQGTLIVALLISCSLLTKAEVLRAHPSPTPTLLLHLPFEANPTASVLEATPPEAMATVQGIDAIWNQACSAGSLSLDGRGILGMGWVQGARARCRPFCSGRDEGLAAGYLDGCGRLICWSSSILDAISKASSGVELKLVIGRYPWRRTHRK
jgi:hypothetical protein